MISVEEAREAILARLQPLGAEAVALEEAAGRVLAERVVASEPLPPFDNSAMDGFAVRAEDLAGATREAPVLLPLAGVAAAGGAPVARAQPRTCIQIFTGAPLPPGTDAVVPVEAVSRHETSTVSFHGAPKPGAFVRRMGDDVAAGDAVLEQGERLTAAAVGLLASLGHARVRAGRRPRVAVHATGDELVGVTEALRPGKIRNSNLFAMGARVREVGSLPLLRPVLADDVASVRQGLLATLELGPDVVITVGGISAGDRDYVRVVAREMGSDVAVRQVNMKPGKPLVFGALRGPSGDVPYFGLPGNPASCLVSFEIFVRPALARLEGAARLDGARGTARVVETQTFAGGGRVQFLRGRVEFDAERGEPVVAPAGKQGSHNLASFARANCLVRLPAGTETLRAGEQVEILYL